MSQQQSFSYKGTGLPGFNQYLARISVLAQGHNTVTPVRLKPVAPQFPVKHSTTALPIAATQKDNQKLVFKTDYGLMQVKSIAECSKRAFCNTFDLH